VDLDVYLNSALKGNTPAIIPDLKPGQYMVQVKNDSFDQIYTVEVEKGTMTRLYITEETSAPLITRKKAGPISDGTLMGYIEQISILLRSFFAPLICAVPQCMRSEDVPYVEQKRRRKIRNLTIQC
jgi:hypothetical protein